jgi:hypothetical protein
MNRFCPFVCVVLSTLDFFLYAAPLAGGEIDPKAQEVAQQVANYLRDARTFKVDIDMTTTELRPNSNLTLTTSHEFAVSKPDKIAFVTRKAGFSTVVPFAASGAKDGNLKVDLPALDTGVLTVTGDDVGLTLVCDGKKSYVSMPYMLDQPKSERSRVVDERRPSELSSFADVFELVPFMGHAECLGKVVIPELFLRNPRNPMKPFTDSKAPYLQYMGQEEKCGVTCHKLKNIFLKDTTLFLFVQAADAPLLKAVEWETNLKDDKSEIRWKHSITFQNWKVGEPLPAGQFKLPTPPSKPNDPGQEKAKAPEEGKAASGQRGQNLPKP